MGYQKHLINTLFTALAIFLFECTDGSQVASSDVYDVEEIGFIIPDYEPEYHWPDPVYTDVIYLDAPETTDELTDVPIVVLHTRIPGVIQDATFVAYRDGDAPWQVLHSEGTGNYRFHVQDKDGRYALMVVFTETSNIEFTSVFLYLLTLSDTQYLDVLGPGAWPPKGAHKLNVTGVVRGYGSSKDPPYITVAVGNSTVNIKKPTGTIEVPFSLSVPPGIYDVASIKGDKAVIFRDLAINKDVTSLQIDFTSVAFDLPKFQASIEGALQDLLTASVDYMTANGSLVKGFPASTTDFQFNAPVGTFLKQGDSFRLLAQSMTSDGSHMRNGQLYFRSPSDRKILLPSSSLKGEVSVIPQSPKRLLRATFSSIPSTVAYSVIFEGNQGSDRSWRFEALASKAYLGGELLIEQPDMSDTPGWNDAWYFPATTSPAFELMAYQCNKGVADLLKAMLWGPLATDKDIPDGLLWTSVVYRGYLSMSP